MKRNQILWIAAGILVFFGLWSQQNKLWSQQKLTSLAQMRSAIGKLQRELTQTKKTAQQLRQPPGTIVAYMGNKPPRGWIFCHGQSIQGDKYKELRAAIGSSNAPELRNYFLRGLPAKGRKLGGVQGDATKVLFNGAAKAGGLAGHRGGAFVTDNAGHKYTYATNKPTWPKKDATAAFDAVYGGSKETRPKNVAVNFMIKY